MALSLELTELVGVCFRIIKALFKAPSLVTWKLVMFLLLKFMLLSWLWSTSPFMGGEIFG